MRAERRWLLAAVACAFVTVAACSSGGGNAASSSPASSSAVSSGQPADAAAIASALASEFAKANTPQAEVDCVTTRVTDRLTVDQLAAIGVTKDGIALPVLGPKSVQLEPTTVTFWDTIFECLPELSDVVVASGSDSSVHDCLQRSIAGDKLLRLTLVFGAGSGQQVPPELAGLQSKVAAAIQACGVNAPN